MKRNTLKFFALGISGFALARAHASGLGRIQFVFVDPGTWNVVSGQVEIVDETGRKARLFSSLSQGGRTLAFDTQSWTVSLGSEELDYSSIGKDAPTTIEIPLGTSVTLTEGAQVPTKEIVIRVTATRLVPNAAPAPTSGSERTKEQLQKFVNTTQTDTRQLTKGQAGVAEDSAGQQHVRGEHTDISYVVDGVPLPDTLSGRAGSIVVPNTIQNLQIITGGLAPEFGGQTAAVLNIQTIASVSKPIADLTLQSGSYNTFSSDLTAEGPIGAKASYVLDLSANRTGNQEEPQQPTHQTAHNSGSSQSFFTKFRYKPDPIDEFALTLSENPNANQIGNRTGLPQSFAQSGQGYGFLGRRNADGTRPDANSGSGLLGSERIVLPSQQQLGMDINQREVNEFAILNFVHRFDSLDSGQIALTYLHSGQKLTNNNPAVDLGNLPVDNSIEYNPIANRNVYHVQLTGSLDSKRGTHEYKEGFLGDLQSGTESYQVIPASRLALDELAALDPALAPPGVASNLLDVNGNPVYTATGSSPTLLINRSGYYLAAYAQDTWKVGRLTSDYGLRFDAYHQHESISATDVDWKTLSPRINLDYKANRSDDLRASYNRLFNTPPLSQGGIVGAPIVPEVLSQYDLAYTRQLTRYQSATLAYYYKDIRNQVDVGLLVPGSQIGLYSGVNFQRGAVHGVELSYNINAPQGLGWDEYFNYSLSSAKPNGLDNTGALVPDYNDHDQRQTVGLGLAYTWRSGLSVAGTFQYNSGLASSVVPPSTSRTPRSQLDLHVTTGSKMFSGKGGLELDVTNVFDSREVINFQSAFSGTRFQQGRSLTLGANFHF